MAKHIQGTVTAALFVLGACSNDTGPSATTDTNLAGNVESSPAASVGSANPTGAVTTLPFIDPTWMAPLASKEASPMEVQNLQLAMFVAKDNPKLLDMPTFRLFVTALYSCDDAVKASISEFDRDRIEGAAIQRLTAYLATQPTQFTVQRDDNLGEWKAATQTLAWNVFDTATYPTPDIRFDANTTCNGELFQAFAGSRSEKNEAIIAVSNNKALVTSVPPLKLDEAAARKFVAANPSRTVTFLTTLQTKPSDREASVITLSSKRFQATAMNVTVRDKISDGVITSASF